MKTNKSIKQLSFAILLTFSLSFFTSCESNDSETLESKSNFVQKDGDPSVSVTVGMRLHRGEKWSTKNGVKPCTQGFGVCSVKVTAVTVEVKPVKVTLQLEKLPKSKQTSNAVARLYFTKSADVQEGQIFISADDDDFIFPSDVANLFNVKELTILADDYIAHVDSDNPFGYVDVKCIAK